MEAVAIYLTKTIQDFLPKSFIIRANKRQYCTLHKIYLLKMILGDAAKIITNHFINENFDDAAKKVYNLITKPKRRERSITIYNNDMSVHTYTIPIDYLFNIKLLTKKYNILSGGPNKIVMSDEKENIIELLCIYCMGEKQVLYDNILGYYNDGLYMSIKLRKCDMRGLVDM